MRKLFLGSIGLMLLSISILLFQISCQKTVIADNNNISQLNKIVYVKAGKSFPAEIWIANTDGTSQRKVSISLPTGLKIGGSACLTPDGNTIIFSTYTDSLNNNIGYIYNCSIDGTNPRKIVDNTSRAGFESINSY